MLFSIFVFSYFERLSRCELRKMRKKRTVLSFVPSLPAICKTAAARPFQKRFSFLMSIICGFKITISDNYAKIKKIWASGALRSAMDFSFRPLRAVYSPAIAKRLADPHINKNFLLLAQMSRKSIMHCILPVFIYISGFTKTALNIFDTQLNYILLGMKIIFSIHSGITMQKVCSSTQKHQPVVEHSPTKHFLSFLDWSCNMWTSI